MTDDDQSTGLSMLMPEREVLVVETEHHQQVLTGYAPAPGLPSRQVVAELVHAPLARRRHAGRPGVEVRLDGHRVGELAFGIALRCSPVLAPAFARAERVGCMARVRRGRHGLIEVELRLPEERHVPVPGPLPDHRSDRSRVRRDRRSGIVAVAATAIGLALMGAMVTLGALNGATVPRPGGPTGPSASPVPALTHAPPVPIATVTVERCTDLHVTGTVDLGTTCG